MFARECCGTCRFYRQTPGDSKSGICIADVPKPLIVGYAQPRLANMHPQPVIQGIWPPVDTDSYCGRWIVESSIQFRLPPDDELPTVTDAQ